MTTITSWSTMDTTFWNLTIDARASLPRCARCFTASHSLMNVNSHPTSTCHQPYLLILLCKLLQDAPSPRDNTQFTWHGTETQVQVAHITAASLTYMYATYTLRKSMCKTSVTKPSTTHIVFRIDQKGHKGPLLTANQLPRH